MTASGNHALHISHRRRNLGSAVGVREREERRERKVAQRTRITGQFIVATTCICGRIGG
jgi:hypothetical protein